MLGYRVQGGPRLVGVRKDGAVGNFGRHPHRALLVRTLSDELHEPRLLAVHARERLAVAGVPMALRRAVQSTNSQGRGCRI